MFKRLSLVLGLLGSMLTPTTGLFADEVIATAKSTQFELLLQARVHEAYGTPECYYYDEPLPAPKVAPASLVEVRPAITADFEKRAVWISGYWEWDSAADSFIWTTGVWRFPPPNHHWVPGKWERTDAGFVRVPGYWQESAIKTVSYVSRPPRYQGSFPLSKTLGDDQFWIPGQWIPADGGKFTWRPGSAARRVANWTWTPDQYSWTTGGWVFVDGYWDYPLDARGQVFASLRVADEKYDADKMRVETFTAIPSTAITETTSGDYVYSVKSLPEKSTFVSVDTVRTVPAAPVIVERAVIESPMATVHGIVRRGDLAPAGIEVELVGHTAGVATTDSQGRFAFKDVPYGVYYVRAHGPVQNHVRRGYYKTVISEPTVELQLELR